MFEHVYQIKWSSNRSIRRVFGMLFSAIMAFASVCVCANAIASRRTVYDVRTASDCRWFLFWFIGVIHLVNFSGVCVCVFVQLDG